MAVRGRNMGLHADPGNATHLARLATAEVGWLRTWAWAEYQWMCSTPDSTSSRGTLDTSTEAAELHAVFNTTALSVMYPFLGVPRAVNPRCGSGSGSAGDGSYHRYAVTPAARALYAADAATVAQDFFGGFEGRGVFCIWNEPNIDAFSRDLFYTPSGGVQGEEATAAVFAHMAADAIAAVRAAVPGLPIGLELGAARGDMNNRGSGLSASYLGDTFGFAIMAWLIVNRPDAMPDLAMFHPYIYTTGDAASLDANGVRSSSPYTSKGWNGILQMDSLQAALAGMGCANRDVLLGTGTGAGRCSRKLLGTEYGGPSREPAHNVSGDQWFTEGWQATHDREYQEVIAFRQAIGNYHGVQVRYTSVDTASATAGSATADLHDYFGLFRQDGTHKPALDTWLTWARKPLDDGVPPDPPIVVPVDPPSPAVSNAFTGPATVYSVVGTGLVPGDFTNQDRCWTRDEQHARRNICRGVLILGGLGGWGPQCSPGALMTPGGTQLWHAICHAMTRRPGQPDGYTFLGIAGQTGVSPTGWGDDSSMTVVEDAIAQFQANGIMGGAAPGKVALIGGSMGHCTAFNYAVRHPEQVAGVIGFNPACSLEYHWNGGIDNILEPPGHGGTPGSIAQAYSLPGPPYAAALDATVKAERDPLTRIPELASMPWGLSYGLDDTVVDRSTVDAFIAAKGGPDAFVWITQSTAPPGVGTHITNYVGVTELIGVLDALAW
jgi:hypothetical protein